MVIDVKNCSWCEEDHPGLPVEKAKEPLNYQGNVFPLVAKCPNGNNVLLFVRVVDETTDTVAVVE